MSKPLTIEQLKTLKEDDWIYIKDLEFGNDFYATVTDTYLGESAKYINIASAGWYQEFWFESYGTKWTAYKNKEQAEGEYDSLAVELEAIKQDKANLERTIEEMNEVLEANGITIDSDGNVNDSRVEQAKKQVAKEILDNIYCVVNRFLDDDTLEYIFDSQYKKYGVEIDE